MRGGRKMKIYATVSRAHIYQAIGLRDRYKEYKHSDECSGCPYRDDNNFDSCIRCGKLKVNYINDANRFGFRHRLNANSLKILLYLHFLNPDKKGRVQASIFDLCDKIGCCRACITDNLNRLTKYGYISVFKNSPTVFYITINDYEQLYLPAKEGGRGYYVMSSDVFEQLKNISNVTSLRIYLSELLSLDSAESKGQATAEERKIVDIRRYLPAYCKRNVIIKKLDENKLYNGDGFMTFKHETGSKVLRIELNPKYKAILNKENMINSMEERVYDFISSFNRNVPFYNNRLPVETKMIHIFNEISTSNASIITADYILHGTFVTDFSGMAVQYGFDLVTSSFIKMYNDYIIPNRLIKNPGGLLRTIVESTIKDSLKTA